MAKGQKTSEVELKRRRMLKGKALPVALGWAVNMRWRCAS
jgi:hypothetical protein